MRACKLRFNSCTLSLRRGLIPVDTPMATSLSTTIGGRHNIGLEQIISNNLRILCFHLQKPFIRGGGYEERSFIAGTQLDFLLLTIGDMDVGEFIVPIPYVKQIKVKLHPAFDVNGLFPFVFSLYDVCVYLGPSFGLYILYEILSFSNA